MMFETEFQEISPSKDWSSILMKKRLTNEHILIILFKSQSQLCFFYHYLFPNPSLYHYEFACRSAEVEFIRSVRMDFKMNT